MKTFFSFFIWLVVSGLGVMAYVALALHRGEHISSAYILIAALCTYAIGYRFYSKWLAARVLAVNDRRAAPCEVHDDGKDFVKTNRWIVFGHHFAAISGPGPLVGPVLAAQFGYLPGTLWILLGVVIGGAVQDFVVLFCSLRRDGKSLAQMIREELNTTAGVIGVAAILSIMIILLAVLALVVVKALAESPWGVFTVGATIPIAMLMGGYLRWWRIGKVLEASAIGVALLLLAVWGGKYVYADKDGWGHLFTLSAEPLAWMIIVYGFAASVLPVWLLLAPRDYLSTFMKLGTIFMLVIGVFVVLPNLQMPAVTQFIDGSGLVLAGKLFPFCFITIACGAISGFHTLIASGTTPKILTREGYTRSVGYGAMCLESLVAIMAMVAACTLEPGVYLAMNVKGEAVATAAKLTQLGFPVTVEYMNQLAQTIGEKTLFERTGGAATLAVGMAQILSKVTHGRWMDLWYHFAIMFEALFILTTLDAGTRVGRYLVQDMLGNIWRPLGDIKKVRSNLLASGLVVAGWGYFLIQGVRDPLGGINSLWPLFGIANQMLAAIALCLGTTIILKMHLPAPESSPALPRPAAGRPAYALVTFIPLVGLLAITLTAGVQKIWHTDPRIGFLAQARALESKQPALEAAVAAAKTSGAAAALAKAEQALSANRTVYFNNVLDAVVAGIFLVLVLLIVLMSVREWVLLLTRRRLAHLREEPPIWLPEYAVAEANPARTFGIVALGLALARELSGEAQMDRAEQQACQAQHCACGDHAQQAAAGQTGLSRQERGALYAEVADARFRGGIKRCC